jgi:site-specific DNA recombinase
MDRLKQGQAPYGFRWQGGQLLGEESESRTRREAFELFLKLKSMGAVARALNTAGWLTRRGGAWSDVQVGRILTCPSAIGRYEIGRSEQGISGKRVATTSGEREIVECDMIVTRTIWEKTQAILSEKSKAPEKENNVHLFTGMVWCHCGQKMKVPPEGAKLDCPGCHAKIPAGDLESIFVEDFFDLVAIHPNLAPAMSASSEHRESQAELAGLQIALQEARSRRDGVEGMLAGGSITRKRFEELHPHVEKEVRQLEAKVKALRKKGRGNSSDNHATLTLAEWKNQWAAWPTKRQRQILTTFVERVTLGDGEVEVAYLLSDSSSKDATQPQQTNPPTNQPPSGDGGGGPVYIRLPKPGEKCPITGLSRAKLNELILPNERNHYDPPVASKSLRKAGAQKGVRLVLLESLMQYLAGKL